MDLFGKVEEHALGWVKDTMAALPTDDPHKALHALRAGLQALRDRLTVEEAAQLSAQLPVLLRGFFFEGWDPTGKPARLRHRAEFLTLVREKYGSPGDVPPDDIVRAVFRVLARHVTAGELNDVILSLPRELVDLVNGSLEGEPRGA
jgi:uncharacterized protein (DUF2267 family)